MMIWLSKLTYITLGTTSNVSSKMGESKNYDKDRWIRRIVDMGTEYR
jgi:hypothetical protein